MSSKTKVDPSPEDLSATKRRLLEQRLRGQKAGLPDRPAGIPRCDPDMPLLASPGQQWIFVAQKSMPSAGGLTLTSSFEIEGPLDLDGLERAIRQVVARHEVLRSNYRLCGNEVEMVPGADTPFGIIRHPGGKAQEIRARAEDLAREPFNLESGPLLRVHHLENREGPSLLLLAVHDIVFDGWSLGLFWSETTAFYRADKVGEPASLPELPIQYADFASWQREQLAAGRFTEQLDYWKRQLSDLPPPIALPVDHPYPPILTTSGQLEFHRLRPGLTKELRKLATGENASLFMVTLLAFQILLWKYTGSTDIIVGSPIANRRRRETAPLIGFFLSTVALRMRFEEDPTVRQALLTTRATTLDAIKHQDLPFNRVVEAVRPPRVSGRHPLCQVMFVHQTRNEAVPSFAPCDAEATHTRIETATSKFDLTLFAAETGEEIEIILEYRTDLFDRETIRRMMGHYEQLLEGMAGNPGQRTSELNCLTREEAEVLFREWQGPACPTPRLPLLGDQVTRQARNAPERTAVVGASRSLSYGELEDLASAIAIRLREAGAGPGTNVGHLMGRHPGALAAILGILKTGAAYVPVDPDYPAERRKLIIEDAGITILVTDRDHQPPATDQLLCLAIEGIEAGTAVGSPPLLAAPDPESPAYLIYTSGSTGRPKGVVVTHANLRHSTAARVSTYESGPQRFLLIPSFSFDSSVAGIFWTLAHGGTLVVPESDDLRDPARLRAIIRDRKVTDMLCVPTLYREILRDGPDDLLSLRRVIVAGERCPTDLVARHFRELPAVDLFNEYGPTEATVWATVHRCSGADADGIRPVPIGRPIANMMALVLDQTGSPLPSGLAGELNLAGPGLARGYWGREDLTTERFVERNLPLLGRLRLYRTGDRVRWRPDGNLEFLGRFDEQLKIRGYRIEAGEIEANLKRHPLIEDCVVVAAAPGRDEPIQDILLAEVAAGRISEERLNRILDEIVAMAPDQVEEAAATKAGEERNPPDRFVERPRFRLELRTKASDFVDAPRKAQRNWLLGQAMEEFADDLEFIDDAAKSFVPGYDHRLGSDLRDVTQSTLTDQEIMEDWQTPLMKAMARCATGSHGDILEIGFGRGVSAEFIQLEGVRSHTVVEPNRHSIDHYFTPWRKRHASRDIRLVEGRWQDVEDRLGLYDGIFFHAFPLNEEEFTRYVLESITFAEHAFAPMAAHLKPGGAFTYLTTEINSLSRRHQRCLFRHFHSISIHVEKLSIPPDTHDTWWADQMVVIRAVK